MEGALDARDILPSFKAHKTRNYATVWFKSAGMTTTAATSNMQNITSFIEHG